MSEKIFNVNINADEIVRNYNNTRALNALPKKKTEFNPKNYLQARLLPGETEKTIAIRLLPFSMEETNPFKKVYIHTVKVNKELSPGGWKTFICPTNNEMGDSCPFCEVSSKAREMRFNSMSEVEKKKYGDIEFMNKAKAAYIVRVIERGHEEDGVKFWLFNDNKQGKGVYDQIIKIQTRRSEKAALRGEKCNIFDVNEGKDLILTISKDTNGKTVIMVVDDDEKTPLTNDFELGNSWINDPKQWTDIYTVKPYDYMMIVVQGGIPVWDKEQNKYVDMSEKIEADRLTADAELKENFTEQTKDFTKAPSDTMGGIVYESESELPF